MKDFFQHEVIQAIKSLAEKDGDDSDEEGSYMGTILDEDNYSYTTYCVLPACLFGLTAVLHVVEIVRAQKTKAMLKDPYRYDSYCVLGYHLLTIVQCNMAACLLLQLYRGAFSLLGLKFIEIIIIENNWLYLIYELLQRVMLSISDLVIILQLLEFIAMIYIIKTQFHRQPDQIMFEHASESLKSTDVSMMPDSVRKKRYRYKELQMSRVFLVYVIIFVSYQILLDIWLMISGRIMNWPVWVVSVEAAYMAVLLLGNFAIFFYLISLLKRFHNFEYQSRRHSMIGYFIVLTLYYFVKTCIAIVLSSCYTYYNPSDTMDRPAICEAFQPKQVQYILTISLHIFNVPQLLLSFASIAIKRLPDPLQGVSKLDNLVLISVFQRPTVFKDTDDSLKISKLSRRKESDEESDIREENERLAEALMRTNIKSYSNSINLDKDELEDPYYREESLDESYQEDLKGKGRVKSLTSTQYLQNDPSVYSRQDNPLSVHTYKISKRGGNTGKQLSAQEGERKLSVQIEQTEHSQSEQSWLD